MGFKTLNPFASKGALASSSTVYLLECFSYLGPVTAIPYLPSLQEQPSGQSVLQGRLQLIRCWGRRGPGWSSSTLLYLVMGWWTVCTYGRTRDSLVS